MAAGIMLVPGIGGSSPDHWQSHWHRSDPARFRPLELSQQELDQPHLDRWIEAIDTAMTMLGPQAVVAAHSLGCLAFVHWAATVACTPGGALLVSPPDPNGPGFPKAAEDFAPVPDHRLRFPTTIVAGRDDPYASIDFATACSASWGSRLCVVERGGHLGDSAGLGDWPSGRSLLERLASP